MAEIINLNTVRKAKLRVAASRKAEENRVRFGRTKQEKAAGKHEQAQRDRDLEGAKIATGPDTPPGDSR